MSLIPDTPALRRRAGALALPAIPVTLLAATLVSPTDSIDNAAQLRAAVAHPGRWQGAALLELLAAVLFPLAAAGVVRVVRSRGAGLAHLGAVLAGLGTLGMTSIALRHLFIYGLTATDQGTALRVLDHLDNHAGAIAFPLMMAGPLAWVVLSAAAARSRLAPRWVIVGAVAYMISDALPIPAAEEVQSLIGIVTFAAIALRLLTHAEEQSPLQPASAPTGRGMTASVPAGA